MNKIKYVYVAGPYTSPDPIINTRETILVADRLQGLGFIPFVPHLTLLWHMVSPHNIDFWYEYDNAWLEKCDALLRLPGKSLGADNEVNLAYHIGLSVYFTIDELILASKSKLD